VHEFPETRDSLLVQVKDPENGLAWELFVQIYRPVIYRIALARGMQDADAHDLAQQVLMSVSVAIGRWEKSSEESKFRKWLSRVTRNAILNALTRTPADRAPGGTSAKISLEAIAKADSETESLVATEYRRELYWRAAAVVRAEVEEMTWKAFELSVLENMPIDQVAKELRKSTGAIYSARSRVMLRLREAVRAMENEQ